MVTVTFEDDEALWLRNALDVVVKATGMRGAAAALHIDRKIMEAAQAAKDQAIPAPKNNGQEAHK
jgi:hypothetical protein